MEKDTVILNIKRYDELIFKEKELENLKKEKEELIINHKKEMQKSFEKMFEHIYEDNGYYIRKIEKANKDDYCFNKMMEIMKSYGFSDLDMIEKTVIGFIERYKKENEGEN